MKRELLKLHNVAYICKNLELERCLDSLSCFFGLIGEQREYVKFTQWKFRKKEIIVGLC